MPYIAALGHHPNPYGILAPQPFTPWPLGFSFVLLALTISSVHTIAFNLRNLHNSPSMKQDIQWLLLMIPKLNGNLSVIALIWLSVNSPTLFKATTMTVWSYSFVQIVWALTWRKVMFYFSVQKLCLDSTCLIDTTLLSVAYVHIATKLHNMLKAGQSINQYTDWLRRWGRQVEKCIYSCGTDVMCIHFTEYGRSAGLATKSENQTTFSHQNPIDFRSVHDTYMMFGSTMEYFPVK